MRRFAETLRLFQKLSEEAASEDLIAPTSALGANRLDEAVLSSADRSHVLLYMEYSAAHT